MSLREFRDELGRWWEAWDVFPRGSRFEAPERRSYVRRRPDPPAFAGADRRRRRDRRISVATDLARGWLSFRLRDDAGERRRLAPVPTGWEQWADERLADLCNRAEPTREPRHQ